MKNASDISQDHAQLLMSQLLDGELSASDAALLDSYLQSHPEAQDWMENLDLIREEQTSPAIDSSRSASISSIQEAISAADELPDKEPRKLLSLSRFIRPMAAAAAIAIVGTLSWMGLHTETQVGYEPNIVEFVATDLPGASTYIYPDEETGWTVVWVDSDPVDVDATQG